MGYSYSIMNGPVMCFNAAKSWQTGWYNSKRVVVSPSTEDCWEGNLYGIADYGNPLAETVLIKLDASSSAQSFFIAYNRAVGMNSGTREAANQVTINYLNNEGSSYAESDLVAKISAENTYTQGNTWSAWSNFNMRVKFVETGTDANGKQYARVQISANGAYESVCATDSPSKSPTPPVRGLESLIVLYSVTDFPPFEPAADESTYDLSQSKFGPNHFPQLGSKPQTLTYHPQPTDSPTPLPTDSPSKSPTPPVRGLESLIGFTLY